MLVHNFFRTDPQAPQIEMKFSVINTAGAVVPLATVRIGADYKEELPYLVFKEPMPAIHLDVAVRYHPDDVSKTPWFRHVDMIRSWSNSIDDSEALRNFLVFESAWLSKLNEESSAPAVIPVHNPALRSS